MKKILILLLFIGQVAISQATIAQNLAPDFKVKIIGGTNVAANDPIAQSTVLIWGENFKTTFICTGSIIAPDLILTAGHCLGGNGYARLTVYFRTELDGQGPSLSVTQQIRMSDTFPDSDKGWEDLAILKLEKNIPDGYHPAKILSDAKMIQDGAPVILAGYGINIPISEGSDDGRGILRSVEQNILQSQFTPTDILINIKDKGSCKGDSGGPAFFRQGNDLLLFGVMSHLTENDRIADDGRNKRYSCLVDVVYTNILAQQGWINSTIKTLEK